MKNGAKPGWIDSRFFRLVGIGLGFGHVQFDKLLNRPRLQPRESILAALLLLLQMHLLPRITHFGLPFGVLYMIDHPLSRGFATAWIFKIQINDNLETPGMNPCYGLLRGSEPFIRGQ